MKIVLDSGAKAPQRAHQFDAGLDLYAKWDIEPVTIPPKGMRVIDTGVHAQIPQHFAGFVKSRSGLMCKHSITTDGVVDADYTGSIHVALFNHGDKEYTVEPGEKIAQLVIVPCCLPPLEVVESLEDTDRGNNGFGSTGRK
jgi:dUTP pyrophosphatase